ncbi:MAG: hypothetical protein IT163_18140 [Bryobacterales bacterium]|nr:hypothetical protein [Bryobacterales bacterium]
MESKFLVPAIGWGVLALLVAVLAIYRMSVGSKEDDQIHLGASETQASAMQIALAHKLEVLDKLGKYLTVAAVLYGAGLVAWAIRDAWIGSTLMPR